MRRILFATIGLLGLAATNALAADLPRAMPPTKAPVFVPGYSWTGFYLGINGGGGFGHSDWSGFATDTDSRAAWSVSPPATTGSPARGCSASKAISTGPTSRATSPTPRARPAAKPRTPGSAPRAAALATRSTAGCPTSPAAPRSATSRRRRPASRSASDTNVGWTVGARHRRRDRRQLDREARVSLCRSRRRLLQRVRAAATQRRLPHASGSRRPELPVLIAPRFRQRIAPDAASGAMRFRICRGQYLFSIS